MKLFFKDTELSITQIKNLLDSHVGPTGPDTWQIKHQQEKFRIGSYIEIYNNHAASCFVKLKW
jgi:hypothetical protein